MFHHDSNCYTGRVREHQEYDIQCAIVEYLEILKSQGKLNLFTAIPNSTYTKSWMQKIKNTKSGVRAGHPDLLIVFPSTILYLELKKEKGGVVSPYQKEWISVLQNRPGVIAKIANGFDSAKNIIDSIIRSQDV